MSLLAMLFLACIGSAGAVVTPGAAVWSASTTPEYNLWEGMSFGTTIPAVDMESRWRIMAASAAVMRDEKIVVGIESGGEVSGQIWDGNNWTSLSINPLGGVSETFWWGADVAYEQRSGDAVLVWNDNPDLRYSVWSGSAWLPPTTITSCTTGEPKQMQLAAKPNSDEMVLVVNHANETDCALVWNGSSWGNVVTLATTTSQDRTDINVVYEQQSGEAVVVFEDDTDRNALFRIWNGSAWSGPTPGTITAPGTVSGYARWTMLAADPQSDRIVLGVLTTNQDVWLAVWNGTGWEPAIEGTLTANGNVSPNVAVAFESNSGQALATYGEGSNLRFRTWVGGTWSGELPGEPSIGGVPNSMTLSADRNSDRVMLSVQDADSTLNYVLWDGTAWGSPDPLEADTQETKNQPFVFVWNSGRDIVINGDFSEWDDGIGNEFCLVDQCGADDWTSPSRLDLTKMCIASNQQDSIYTMLAVDDVTLSGQIITSCMLMDTDDPDNGFADYVLCMTLEGSGPTTVQAVELFSCDDTAVDGCPGATMTRSYATSNYGFSNTETGPFGDADSFLELKFPYSDLGITGGQVLFSSYISYPGRGFLTSPKDSIFCNEGAQDYEARIDYDLDNGSATTVPVTLAYFRSKGSGSVRFDWATSTETGNLGFHLYELTQSGLQRLNQTLIASKRGDALTPQRYRLEAADVTGSLFVLEDVDVFGQTRYHGPFELGQRYGRETWNVKPTDWAGIRREHERKSAARRPRPRVKRASSFRRSSGPSRPAEVHLRVREEGIYRVTYEALIAAGIDLGGTPAAQLALLEKGKPVPIRVEGRRFFGAGSFIEFVGRGLDTLYTDANVYTLLVDSQLAVRAVGSEPRLPTSGRTPAFYYETRRVETNRAYDFAAPGEDPWYDTRLLAISEPVEASYALELEDRLPGAGSVELTVAMWGVTDFSQTPDHHVVIEVNGVEMADEWFDGLENHPVRVEIPEWVLEPEGNQLRVRLPHDTGARYDLVNYDHYEVRFPRPFEAVGGRLHFTAAAPAFRIDGLPSSDVVVYRVRGDTVERVESVSISGLPGDYRATFPGSEKPATYYVSAVEALVVPQATLAPQPQFRLTGKAEMLIIAHPDFLEGLEPLVTARRLEGLSVRVVNVEDLYAWITHGVFDPQAIRTFVRRAHRKLGTEYVLLVGGDTYDYFDYLGQGAISFVPTLYTRTDPIVHYAPVDPLYGDIDYDGLPEVAVGRWPVRTTAELAAIIDKTLEYGSVDYLGTAVLAADAYDVPAGRSFAADSEQMVGMLPPDWQVTRAYLDEMELYEARQVLVDEISNGVALTSYFGHSGPSVWSFHGLFHSSDADTLQNFGRPTVVTQWGCWNTYYVSPSYDTLGHRLLLNPDGGAAAVLGASTLTNAASERELGRRVFQRVAVPGQTLGRAVIEAKRDLASTDPDLLDVLLGWTLLGDPTLVIEP